MYLAAVAVRIGCSLAGLARSASWGGRSGRYLHRRRTASDTKPVLKIKKSTGKAKVRLPYSTHVVTPVPTILIDTKHAEQNSVKLA
jgi:hypothetical protein